MKYLAEFRLSPSDEFEGQTIGLPMVETIPTKVTQIYPTANVVPANLLRFPHRVLGTNATWGHLPVHSPSG